MSEILTVNFGRVAVVIPCFRVTAHILDVLSQIGEEVWRVYVVDDCCPDKSGDYVEANCQDNRIIILRHEYNRGVGGAVMTGYAAAIEDGADVIVKIDGDGQMDPRLIMQFVDPILNGSTDYTKGNRFFDLRNIKSMPFVRIFGNAILSFMTKFSSGYWDLFDPTNGYTAIHSSVARRLPFEKISNRYFFETDILFRLNTLRAVVTDIPMDAKYDDEKSNLKISKILVEFLFKHLRNFIKRIFYNYYLRDLSIASIELPMGVSLFLFGLVFGTVSWLSGLKNSFVTPPGTVMLSALPIIIGMQLILSFLSYDITMVPRRPIQQKIVR
jgi:dolichol-phosphate mannosyltransferase